MEGASQTRNSPTESQGASDEGLIKLINVSPEKLEELILTYISQHKTEKLSYLFFLGVNIFTFKTTPKLLFYPVLLIKLVLIYLFSRPINYAGTIRAEEATPEHHNCALLFPNNIATLKKYITISTSNTLSMSNYNQLTDYYYFAALIFLLNKYGGVVVDKHKGSELIDSIQNKPKTCDFADYIIDLLNMLQDGFFLDYAKKIHDLSLKNQTLNTLTLGKKIHAIMVFCSSTPDRQLNLPALMISYPHPSANKKSPTPPAIPKEIIFSVVPEFGQIQNLTLFYKHYIQSYCLEIEPFSAENLVQKIFETVKKMNTDLPNPSHHLHAILSNLAKTAPYFNIITPLIIIIGLTKPAIGDLFYKKCLTMAKELNDPSYKLPSEFSAKNLIEISTYAVDLCKKCDLQLQKQISQQNNLT